jgi:hypothetical protein
MNTSEVLNTAADLLEERGWRPGDWGGPGSTLCLEGGILAALGIDHFRALNQADTMSVFEFWACPAYRAVADHLGMDVSLTKGRQPAEPLWQWNDGKGRTAAEVIEVLRACAVIEAAREEQDAAWETYAEVVTA